MSTFIDRLTQLSAAEEFLDFFAVPYQQGIVNVNRLHILKRFYQYLRQDKDLVGLAEADLYKRYRSLLVRAYEDFVRSTPAEEKVFKVFQEADGSHVTLDSLRTTLPSQR